MTPPASPPGDLALLDIAAEAYGGPWAWAGEHVRVLRAETGGYVVAAFQGTVLEAADILRDLRCLPWWHRRVGFCPAGFLKGVVDVMDALELDLGPAAREGRLVLTGHSLGAALAEICAGWWCALGAPPAKLLSIAPPRSGTLKLARLLTAIPEARAYRCGDDPVPELPWFFRHPLPLIPIGRPLADPLHCHRLAAYRAALSDHYN